MSEVVKRFEKHTLPVRAALFDIDGTLTSGGKFWDGLLKSPWVRRGQKNRLYATTLPQYFLSQFGVLDQAWFRDRWVHRMAGLMTGWPVEQVESIYTAIVQDYLVPNLRPDLVALLRWHKAEGHRVLLVSTMFQGIVEGLAAHLEADAALGSVVEMRDGYSTGRIAGPTCSGGRKVEFARVYLAGHWPDITLDHCAAYADSRSDIAFLAGVGHPVAVYPDPVMRAAALEHGWQIYEQDADQPEGE